MGGQMSVAYVFGGLLAISPLIAVPSLVLVFGIVTLIASAFGLK